jgi:hypothetical protein
MQVAQEDVEDSHLHHAEVIECVLVVARADGPALLEAPHCALHLVALAVEALVDFEFDAPLEDPSLVFLRSRADGLHRFTPPPVGTRLVLSE